MRKISTILLMLILFSQLLVAQVSNVQKVALGSKIEYSVLLQSSVSDLDASGYTFVWTIDKMGKRYTTGNEGVKGVLEMIYSSANGFKAGDKFKLQVYSIRNVADVCPSNIQEQEIEIISEPQLDILAENNIGVCSYSKANSHTPINFTFNVIGFVGTFRIQYEIENHKGDIIATNDIELETASPVVDVAKDIDNLFVNETSTDVIYKLKIKSITFMDSSLTSMNNLEIYTQSIVVVPAVKLGKITF
ncbi:hypothetical protein E0494_02280 [Marinilabiliaceae bacterium JC040]|nr:hypothetical protein [Marinilabiliaceae bacterium JC040]